MPHLSRYEIHLENERRRIATIRQNETTEERQRRLERDRRWHQDSRETTEENPRPRRRRGNGSNIVIERAGFDYDPSSFNLGKTI